MSMWLMNELMKRQYMRAQQQGYGGLMGSPLGGGGLADPFAQYATSGIGAIPTPEPQINRKLLLLGDVQ